MLRLLKITRSSFKNNWLAKSGVVLILLAVLMLLAVYGYFESIEWRPVDKAITLQPGMIELTFTVNYTGRYFVDIEFNNGPLSQETIQCLTGVTAFSPRPQCTDKPILDLNLRLNRDGKTIVSNRYADDRGGGVTNSTVEAELGYFDAKRGGKYTLIVEVKSDASRLDATKPTLLVSLNSVNLESALVLEGLSRFAAAVLGIPGLILLVSGICRYRRRPAS